MEESIIKIEQLPVITQRLQTIKADVTGRVNEAKGLVCTEDTVKTVKQARAELNKEFTYWENKRKEVKKAVLTPYEQFESIYKDCITDVFKAADKDLKSKIDSVECELKEQKRKEVTEYFDEYVASKGIDFLTFEKANINVTLSASMKSLKEQAKVIVDRVCDDLELIETQERKEEILYEYKRCLVVSAAIKLVADRYKAIEEAKARAEERRARAQAMQEAAAKVEEIAPTVEPIVPPVVEEPTLTVAFKVTATRSQAQRA